MVLFSFHFIHPLKRLLSGQPSHKRKLAGRYLKKPKNYINNEKIIKIIIVYSTSGAAYVDANERKEMYRRAIKLNSL
jgi:hypothetical protein